MSESASSDDAPTRFGVVRDVILFQAKLWLEGFKDVALMPLSAGAAAIDFIFGSSTLYSVMRLGDRFERWVHLYAALEKEPEEEEPEGHLRSFDHLLNEAADGIESNAMNGQSETSDSSRSTS